jgi:hypothetical protein
MHKQTHAHTTHWTCAVTHMLIVLIACMYCCCADTTIEKTLQRLGSTFDMVPLPAEGSNYIKPASVMFELDGKHLHAQPLHGRAPHVHHVLVEAIVYMQAFCCAPSLSSSGGWMLLTPDPVAVAA